VTEQLLQACQSLLHEQGFGHYEVSAYARAGCASRHNQIYWTYGDYLGLGAGAHGKLSGPTRSEQGAETPSLGIWRSQRPRDPRRFQREACKSPAWVPVLISERPFEFMLNALRLIEGVPTGLFRARTGLAWASQTMRIEHLLAEGYLQGDPLRMGCLRVSTHGLRFLNNALLPFLP
jgi:coproporphyrinogen III oxidase-like Fe-S oxidoreductase